MQKRHAGACARDLIALLKQQAAHALKADGEAHGGNLLADKLAHHFVIAAAACHSAAKALAGGLEHHAGVVALAAHQTGCIGDAVAAVSHLLAGGNDIP